MGLETSLCPDNQQLSTINTTINTTIKMVAGDMRGSLEEILLDDKAIRDLSMDELNAIFQERALGEQRISEIKERRRKLKNRAAAARSRDVRRVEERRLQEQLQNEERGLQEIEDGLAALRPVGNDNDA